jgi:DnaK suppressor protein
MTHTLRTADLKRMLTDRRREVSAEIRSRVRGTRNDRSRDVQEELERADASTQGDIELALVQMGLQTVARIDDALIRLDAGQYGSCLECAREISELRLRVLPFAVRCQACEERREQDRERKEASDKKSRVTSQSLDVLSP